MSPLDHWKRDHISNVLTDAQVRGRVGVLTPMKPCVCGACGWPGAFTDLCSLCTSLAQSIVIMRDRTYWREWEAQERMTAQQVRPFEGGRET